MGNPYNKNIFNYSLHPFLYTLQSKQYVKSTILSAKLSTLQSMLPLVHALSSNLTPFSSLRMLIAWSCLLHPVAVLLYISIFSSTHSAFDILLSSTLCLSFLLLAFPNTTYTPFLDSTVFINDFAILPFCNPSILSIPSSPLIMAPPLLPTHTNYLLA